MSQSSALFVGRTQILINCVEQWLKQGHAVSGIVSDCDLVREWASKTPHTLISPKSDLTTSLGQSPFDLLFSIVNHSILPDHVLNMPRRHAINYHDSPLPKYAGFNSTAWAIIDGASTHGVTWHTMTSEVDSGDILLQRTFPISDEDTSFSLGVNCANACSETFAELVEALEQEERSGTPVAAHTQGPGTQFHLRSERPGLGLIDFEQPAEHIDRLIRGLQFGREDNWMCKPKLYLGEHVFLVDQAELSGASAPAKPGQVLAVDATGIEIAASDRNLRLSGLMTLSGESVEPGTLGLAIGDILPSPRPSETELADLDAKYTKQERFWVRRLAHQKSPALSQIKDHDAPAEPTSILRDRRRDASEYVTALSICLWRASGTASFDLALSRTLPKPAARFYADAVPLRVSIAPEDKFSNVQSAIEDALAAQLDRGSYAKDAVTRYEQLRGAKTIQSPLSIGLQLDGPPALVSGTALTLSIDPETDHVTYSFDQNAISKPAVESIAARVETLLAEIETQSDTSVSKLNLLPEDEKRRLLDLAHGPVKDYPKDKCVHTQFEAQVARTPDATAVVFQQQALTYRDLDRRANQIASHLIGNGVEAGDLVAVCVKRSTELVAALLGVMKAGAAYVPMDPSYPADRLAIMLEDSQAKVILTQADLQASMSFAGADAIAIETIDRATGSDAPSVQLSSENLAYVIFTSGSTGRPKGVKVAHNNVSNFFAGMDDVIGTDPGVWLAVTSVSFDISVLEIFWTLSRGFEVIVQGETDRSSLSEAPKVEISSTPMDFGMFYFSSSQGDARPGETYKLLIEGAKFADANGFQSVWTPERHFHEFGGIFPNPAVTTAALSTITKNVALRAGSVVLPLHNPVRVAEDWSVLDQLSNGRVGLSFASGWHANDFALMPENYERRREIMVESIDTVFKLWAGEEVEVENGEGTKIKVSTFPRPIQDRPPIWIASAGNIETFKEAGRIGANILTNMLGQDLEDLRTKLAAYREARAAAGFEGPGQVSLMLHTFVCDDTEKAREIAREPFCNYLQSSFDLVKVAPWMFPAFKRPSLDTDEAQLDATQFTDEDLAALMDHAFDRYFDTAGLFGSPEHAAAMVEKLKSVGVNEIACLVDFGIESDLVLENLPHLNRLRELTNSGGASAPENADEAVTVGETFKAHAITHLQCTPSMARMLIDDPEVLDQFGTLKHLMLGGEALPEDLADTLGHKLSGEFTNMYGPTETTIWSSTAPVKSGEPVTIGRPIANTTIRLLDANGNMSAFGEAGELWIGGDGVVPGYLGRDDLTAERFIDDPYAPGERLYHTGDLARYKASGEIEYLGRIDQQVKINGYRIELGEIETQLSRHPDIWQSVVVAHTTNAAAQLVAYYNSAQSQNDASEMVDHWQGLWDAAYRQSDENIDARFNFSGWNDSYTGAPIPEEDMREWRDATQRTLLNLNPNRVLEIGCGTGMVLYALLANVEHYTGTDISPNALEKIKDELTSEEQGKVSLRQMPAHGTGELDPQSYDTVVINSVAQYFPSADYLRDVLTTASELVADGGQIFVGDVRSLDLLDAFHTVVELNQAPSDLASAALESRIQKRVSRESELVLSDKFFQALVRDVPRLQGVSISLKRGAHANEMSDFRYDVVLHVGDKPNETLGLPDAKQVSSADDVRSLLESGDPVVFVQGLENARLAPVMAARSALKSDSNVSVSELRATLEQDRISGINPGDMFDLHADYDVALMRPQAEDLARFDVVFRHKSHSEKSLMVQTHDVLAGDLDAYANTPASSANDQSQLVAQLRTHLREHLPEYMIPSTFVEMDTFPLTPNGKIDRNALPAPSQKSEQPISEYVPPSNDLETLIADVWKELLGVTQVGRTDNIFDIGANSLMTAQANQRLSKKLDRRVSLVSMFRYPTVESLAAHLGDKPKPDSATPAKAQKNASRREQAAAKRRAMRREQLT